MVLKFIRKQLKKRLPRVYKKSFKLRSFLFKVLTKKQNINLVSEFFEHSPGGSGAPDLINNNILYNIKNISSSLNLLIKEPKKVRKFNELNYDSDLANELMTLFEKNGSDKHLHNYHLIYSYIFSNYKIENLLEIGLGSNDENILSSMGGYGTPGGCLRTFSEILNDKAKIVGLDIDESILFNEKNIQTFYFDQLNLEHINKFSQQYSRYFDLLIDDGLHSNISMINTIHLAKTTLRENGILVIEDIFHEQLNYLNIAFNLCHETFEYEIYSLDKTYIIIANLKNK